MRKLVIALVLVFFSGALWAAPGDMAYYSPKDGTQRRAVVVNLSKKLVSFFAFYNHKWNHQTSKHIAVVKKGAYGKEWLVYFQSTEGPMHFSNDWRVYFDRHGKWYKK